MHLEIKDIKLSILTISSISSVHFPSLILENLIFSNSLLIFLKTMGMVLVSSGTELWLVEKVDLRKKSYNRHFSFPLYV